MRRLSTTSFYRYLLGGKPPCHGCLRSASSARPTWNAPTQSLQDRFVHVNAEPIDPTVHVPLRKQLKDEARQARKTGKSQKKDSSSRGSVPDWELTVGVEIHAQLNTARKLFSAARGDAHIGDIPNRHIAPFDLAIPGSQPIFQKAVLIPALRAALALGCSIQPISRFDRKHYFHWDQPAGYQITQYYEPLARHGSLRLLPQDGIAAHDGSFVDVSIVQVQLEQDTAKTMAQPGSAHWIDFNRAGVPLVEIITGPDIHSPATAAALVRKVQSLLNAVDACVSGMEIGGLRADVNVSVRRDDSDPAPLGTRTEIKNLSSFKAVEDAIVAERNRQIAVLEAGGRIEGETRGWTIGGTETRRLRGKEGEVDYRYMPDPDLSPVVIGQDLVDHLSKNMGQLPDAEVAGLVEKFGLTIKDALSLLDLNGGHRLEYFWNVVTALDVRGLEGDCLPAHRLAANWILHELGRLTSNPHDKNTRELEFTADGQCVRVPVYHLADILHLLHHRRITLKVAKELLWVVFRGDVPNTYDSVSDAVETENMWFRELSMDEYVALADTVMAEQPDALRQFASYKKYPQGKLMFLVGRMMRIGPEERIDPRAMEVIMKRRIEEVYPPPQKKGAEE